MHAYLPQATLLPHCDLVVSHGGSGSVIGALAHGLPSVLIPIGADQPANADRCVALGVGRRLDAATLAPDALRAAVTAGLSDALQRRNAQAIRAEIESLPGPEHALEQLEHLVFEQGLRPHR